MANAVNDPTKRQSAEPIRLTPTEAAIYQMLSDGQAYTRNAIKKCLPDELAAERAIAMHISNLRRKLRPEGLAIICQVIGGRFAYRLIRCPPLREPV